MAGGLMMLGKGLRRGGLFGLFEAAMGGAALLRGMTGRCEAKRILSQSLGESQPLLPERYSHMPLDSEVHSPDFENTSASMPDATPMGHEARPDQGGSKR